MEAAPEDEGARAGGDAAAEGSEGDARARGRDVMREAVYGPWLLGVQGQECQV